MSEGIFRIYQTETEILIHNLLNAKIISINDNYGLISNKELDALNSSAISEVYKSFGILGILQLGVLQFLLYIVDSEKVGHIGSTGIFSIKKIDYIPIMMNKRTVNFPKEIMLILNNFKNLFSEGFYFSLDYDLTNSLQNQKIIKIKNNNNYDFIKDANPDFLWNYELYSKFFHSKIDKCFMVNLIYGYFGIIQHKINDQTMLNYILLSRRSTQNAGLKSLRMGIDSNGNCANYVETEQIVIINNNVFSYVQVRAQPPLFYGSSGENTDLSNIFLTHLKSILNNKYKFIFILNLLSSEYQREQNLTDIYENVIKETNLNFLKYSYFDLQTECLQNEALNNVGSLRDSQNLNNLNNLNPSPKFETVEDIFDIFNQTNLNGKTGNAQNSLNSQHAQHVQRDLSAGLDLTDIMHNSPNNKNPIQEDKIDVFLNKLECIFSIFKFFGIYYTNQKQNLLEITESTPQIVKTYSDQVGVIRTNCFNGLEKSNLMQMRIAWKVFLLQLKCIDINGEDIFGDICKIKGINNYIINSNTSNDIYGNLLHIEDFLPNKTSSFLMEYKRVWTQMSKDLSNQYLGEYQNSSLMEVSNELSDELKIKQRCIDILLSKYNVKLDSSKKIFLILVSEDHVKKELESNLDRFSNSEEISLYIGTWNVGGRDFKEEIDLRDWLFPKNKFKKTPDIYVIGLQEIVELNANFLLISSNQYKVDYWKNTIKNTLAGIDK